jgi:hypothetical protein
MKSGKYITKGQDRSVFSLNETNEVERYANARNVSASEAYWRIYGFELHHRSPAVMKLQCHLENEQIEVYEEGDAENVLERGPRKTTLTEYFERNKIDPKAREILYPDFPEHYTWNKTGKFWKERARGGTIGRIPVISLNAQQTELFYLRLLLHNKPGATSFEDLRRIDVDPEPTFQEACNKMGLLESDDELDRVMEECSSIRFGESYSSLYYALI